MTARKVIGILILIFMAIPILFGVTWAVGLIKASVSPKFLSDLPREIIDKLPESADAIFTAGQDKDFIEDSETRVWFQAAAKTGTSMRELMQTTGITGWMQGELSSSLKRIGEILRGESPVEPVMIDMRPFKKALLDPAMDKFLEGTVANLPPCDENGLKAWRDLASGSESGRDLPACNPDPVLAREALLTARNHAVRDMHDTVDVFEGVHPFPSNRFGIARAVTAASYAMFLIPALFILLGVLIGESTSAGRLRWSGIAVLAGSVPVLIMAFGIEKFSAWLVQGGIFRWHTPWTSDVGHMVLDKLSWIPTRCMDTLFSPVVGVAAVISVAGIVLLALASSSKN
ncbi:MAG: hypothetical protein PHI34_02800 [Acidobacteriota bacterium]|nr:hypothetical protein [Acidobacteriota bacterium]